jgi:aldose sugar dehydrogenase
MNRLISVVALALAFFVAVATPALADPPPAETTTEVYAEGRSFPVAMAFAPDGRLFYTEKGVGASNSPEVMTLSGSPGALTEVEWLSVPGVNSEGERGLLGITLDPDFATNGYVYLFYTNADPLANRVVRYTEQRAGAGAGTADPASELVLMEVPISAQVDATNSNHNGGNIHFGPDGYLYVTHGELGRFPAWSQDITAPFDPGGSFTDEPSAAPGKIHRLDVDNADPADQPNAAPAPADNPFFDDGNPLVGNDDRIWTFGHRNSFDFTFDLYDPPGATGPTGTLFATENGPGCNDEILRVVEGYNHRWPLDNSCPSTPQDATGPNPGDPAIPPLAVYPSTIAPTGIVVYNGSIPEWQGDVFFCAINTNNLYHAELNASRTAFVAAPEAVDLPEGACGLDVENGPNGALYFATTSAIYRIRYVAPTAVTVGALQTGATSAPVLPWAALGLLGLTSLTLVAARRARS